MKIMVFFVALAMTYSGSLRQLAAAERDVAQVIAEIATEAQNQQQSVVIGRNGWLFLTEELRHLGVGPFWGEHAAAASVRDRDQDPLAAIVDFNRQLKELGIELLVVPVPPRAAVYADYLDPQLDPTASLALSAFHQELAAQGVRSLDLLPLFRQARSDDAELGPVVCRSDSHWSPRGMALASQAIIKALGQPEWLEDAPPLTTRREASALGFQGDLIALSGMEMNDETVTIENIVDTATDAAPATSEASPLLLLADSHGLVFSAGDDMHAQGAGLREHLAADLGTAIDTIAIRGSAASGVRVQLARRFHQDEDYRAKKQTVVWVFAGRSLSEATDGWKIFPIFRP